MLDFTRENSCSPDKYSSPVTLKRKFDRYKMKALSMPNELFDIYLKTYLE